MQFSTMSECTVYIYMSIIWLEWIIYIIWDDKLKKKGFRFYARQAGRTMFIIFMFLRGNKICKSFVQFRQILKTLDFKKWWLFHFRIRFIYTTASYFLYNVFKKVVWCTHLTGKINVNSSPNCWYNKESLSM